MKEIPLTQGKVALVDDEDYEYLMQWKWCVKKHRNTIYACRSTWIKGEGPGRREYMHRVIMKTPDDMSTDHINHNGLDNQKHNLRICAGKENNRNRKVKSKYLGVFKSGNKRNPVYAKITVNRKQIYLGAFKDEVSAAKAYDRAAKIHYREFAGLNFNE